MKIMGANSFGHDTALFHIDTIKKEIFAMSTERVTRIKHDSMGIGPILEKYSFSDVDYFCHGYGDFDEPVEGIEGLRGSLLQGVGDGEGIAIGIVRGGCGLGAGPHLGE